MAFTTLSNISNDLKTRIVDEILLPSDLVNLCLVSTAFYDVAVRVLYRSVTLFVGGAKDYRLAVLCSHRNQGLKHIKNVFIAPIQATGRSSHSGQEGEQTALIIRMLLEALPHNVLHIFACIHPIKLSNDNLLFLYKTQQSLQRLGYALHEDGTVIPALQARSQELRALFSNCSQLVLNVDSQNTLELGQYYLKRIPHVALLEIASKKHHVDGAIRPRELRDGPTGPGLLTRTLFRHMLPFDRCTPLSNLKSLSLDGVSLRYCRDTFCRIIDFQNLVKLTVRNCPGADSLLAVLCKGSAFPRQLVELVLCHHDNKENEVLAALDVLLCLVSGLEFLIIDLENVASLPAAEGIARQGKTLQVLSVHAFKSGPVAADDKAEIIWCLKDFEKVCKSFVKLEQLSCGFPHTPINRHASRSWRCFAQQAVEISSLVTLRITTWPGCQNNSRLGDFHPSDMEKVLRESYTTLLQSVAHKLFDSRSRPHLYFPAHRRPPPPLTSDTSEVRSSRLRLIVFGSLDMESQLVQRGIGQVIYLRSTLTTAFNQRAIAAVPLPSTARQYIEPRSDVLDYLPLRIASMPVLQGTDPEPIDFVSDPPTPGDAPANFGGMVFIQQAGDASEESNSDEE